MTAFRVLHVLSGDAAVRVAAGLTGDPDVRMRRAAEDVLRNPTTT
jgi:hypothetical protein